MIDSHKYISTQIEKDIPQFIRMEYPAFVTFIVKYYEYLEQEGAPYHFIANTLNYADVDRTSLQLLDEFAKAFISPLPDLVYDQNNIKTLIKNIEQHYSAVGSEKAFEFMFRLFEYKEDTTQEVEFYYPSYDMLRISDGKWVNEKTLKIIDPPDDVMDWESSGIVGEDSGAKAVIDEIKVYQSTGGVNIAELYLMEFDVIHTAEKFEAQETISGITRDGVGFSGIIENVLFRVSITDSANYYGKNQRIHVINTGSGEDGRIVVDNIGKGSIDSFTIVSGGSGYAIGDRVYCNNKDYGSGAYGKVSTIGGSGDITDIELVFGGHDYTIIPQVNIESDLGSGAVVFVESTDIGKVTAINIKDFGINYLTSDTTLIFNTMIRTYNINIDFDIGEEITGIISSATGIIEYWDKDSGVMSMYMTNGTFQAGEQFVGSRWGGDGYIYDISLATGIMIEGGLCEYSGRYLNDDGHISALKYIQDSYFYQMFSYMIKTEKKKEEWVDYIQNTHPAGTLGFSYRDIISQYLKESYGGFISPRLDTTEFYKFRFIDDQYHGGHIRNDGNTQIKQYKDVVIDDNININNNVLNKTKFTLDADITIT